MGGFLGWVMGVVADLLDWFVGIWSLADDGGGLHLQVMDFASVLMRFLLVCGGSGVFPLHLDDKCWPCYCSPTDVQYDAGAGREAAALLSFIHALRLLLFALDVAGCHVGWQVVSALFGV